MKHISYVVGAVILAVMGAGATAPVAHAEGPEMNGVYSYVDEDGDFGTWTVNTTCAPTCVAHVATGPGRGFDAVLVDGVYTVNRSVPAGLSCPDYMLGDLLWDAGEHPVQVWQWWDPTTLKGEVHFLATTGPCEIGDHHDHFTLTPAG
ncbi:hypothetical protein [Mycobacterium sp. TY815]|uniref:hypothetical protein n=1 Tax=Mycobacterium sp. TY815 TaxID=3050581 RepID=UPI0027412BF4|nr:hypothetical protein [Mycobacterium sp. TY815]MDP7704942.1 hypothetical protein [Mycobacterium sp. TY815]